MAQVITGKTAVFIGRIFNPVQAMGVRVCLKIGTRNIQQRAPNYPAAQSALTRHAGQPVYTRPAQQPEQHGFGLIIAMLPRKEHLLRLQDRLERLIARLPRCPLDTCTGGHLHAHHRERHAQGITQQLTMSRPRIRYSL